VPATAAKTTAVASTRLGAPTIRSAKRRGIEFQTRRRIVGA
jgi:hypothetical protein